ncbi:MAG: DNA-processing protein DprA [Ketobacteraceae bacterium]|nr:DNA-processing protein DprA [Ketobacteraceae bacterium]
MATDTDLPFWLALWRVPNLGASLFNRLLSAFDSLQSACESSPKRLMALGLNQDQISAIKGFLDGTNQSLQEGVALDLEWLSQENHHLVTLLDPGYPSLLKEITSPPPLLFVKGDPDLLNWPQIAIVGSRHPSRQGVQNAAQFAEYFVRQGFTVTSGLAMGVDAAAHEGALKGEGHTIGVTAHGLDSIYPKRSRALADAMLEKGAWVSEFPVGVAPKPAYFPRRNRIISGLSMGVLVVEAAVKSGSLITARQAIDQNREVFAIPGSIHNPLSRGCHAMIRQGAKLVEKAEDVTEELLPLINYQRSQLNLDFETSETVSATHDAHHSYANNSTEYQILSVLDHDPMLVDEIVTRTGMNVADINAALVMLELDGAVTTQPAGYALATPAQLG